MRPVRYVDYSAWFRHELREWAESILLDPRTLNRDYWNTFAIQRLLEHLGGTQLSKKLARQIAALISFELWHRTYLDN